MAISRVRVSDSILNVLVVSKNQSFPFGLSRSNIRSSRTADKLIIVSPICFSNHDLLRSGLPNTRPVTRCGHSLSYFAFCVIECRRLGAILCMMSFLDDSRNDEQRARAVALIV